MPSKGSAEWNGDPAKPVGLGAFTFESYTPGNGNSFKAKKNPDYWRGPKGITGEDLPYLDEVEGVVYVDADSRFSAVRSGDVANASDNAPGSLALNEETIACGTEPRLHVLDGHTTREECATDLGSKLAPPARELCDVYRFDRRAVRTDINALVRYREGQLRHVAGISGGSRIVYGNDAPDIDPRRVVLFGDSYAFHETGLGPMLAETFREVHVLWSSSLDLDYIARVKPDLVIHEIAERFLRRVPRDGVNVDALAEKRLAKALRQAGKRT